MKRNYMKAEDRREEILEAARKVFCRRGYQNASIGEVCSAIHIARGTLYQYFKNKNDLFRALLQDHVARVQEFMQPVAPNPPPGRDIQDVTPDVIREFLSARLRFIFEAVLEEKDIFRIFVMEAQAADVRSQDLIMELNRSFLDLIQAELDPLVQAGLCRAQDTRVSANLIFGGLLKLCFDRLVMEGPPDIAWLAEQAADFMLRGILKG